MSESVARFGLYACNGSSQAVTWGQGGAAWAQEEIISQKSIEPIINDNLRVYGKHLFQISLLCLGNILILNILL